MVEENRENNLMPRIHKNKPSYDWKKKNQKRKHLNLKEKKQKRKRKTTNQVKTSKKSLKNSRRLGRPSLSKQKISLNLIRSSSQKIYSSLSSSKENTKIFFTSFSILAIQAYKFFSFPNHASWIMLCKLVYLTNHYIWTTTSLSFQ